MGNIKSDSLESRKEDCNMENIRSNSLESRKGNCRYFWFRLLIDEKHKLNVFQIRKNKAIYLFTNFIVFLSYFNPIFCLVTAIVIKSIGNIDIKFRNDFLIGIVITMVLNRFFLSISHGLFMPRIFSDMAHLVHSKYLIDKFLYFYNIDLTDFNENELVKCGELSSYGPLVPLRYLKEKDILKLKINDNIKNSGRICKIYEKDKEKAIESMKSSIKFFYTITSFSVLFWFVCGIIFIIVWAITF